MGKEETREGVSKRLAQASRTSSVHVLDGTHVDVDLDKDFSTRAKVGGWVNKQVTEFKTKAQTYTPLDWLKAGLPCMSWIIGYKARSPLL